MSGRSAFKTNHDLMVQQQQEFTKGGVILRNIFGISTSHPGLSVIFALSFGVVINALYDLIAYPFVGEDVSWLGTLVQIGLLLAPAITCWLSVERLKYLHRDLFKDTPLSQKKVLVTLVSKGRGDFRDTPSYNTFQSLLYSPGGQATANALEKVILVATPEVVATANDIKSFAEGGNRQADVYGISIDNKSILDIQAQMEHMLTGLAGSYAPHEIIVDYTGGTKDMSVGLLRASEKMLITPIYLNSATSGQYSRY